MSNRLCCGVESKYVDNVPGKEYYYCTKCKNEVTGTSPLFCAEALKAAQDSLHSKHNDYIFRAFLNGEIDSDQAVLLLNHEDSGAKLECMGITSTTDNSFIVTRELWESWNSQDEN